MKKRNRSIKTALILAWTMAAVLALVGCTSSTLDHYAEGTTVAETAAASAMYENDMFDGGKYAAAQETMAEAEQAAMAGEGKDMTDGQVLAGSTGTTAALPNDRKLIRDVDMNVETNSFDTLLSAITAKVTELGGYIEHSEVYGASITYTGSSMARSAGITARIPNDKLDLLIKDVENNGNVLSKSESVTDVTLQYIDVESHKKALSVEQERIWTLLEKAESLDAVVTLESRLSEIRYQLESYESQLRLYDNQVAYGTVNITLTEVKVFTPAPPAVPDSVGTRIKKGFQKSFNGVVTAFTDLFVWTVSNSPVLVILAVILITLILIVRKLHRRQQLKEAAHAPLNSGHDKFWAAGLFSRKGEETRDKKERETEEPSKEQPKDR